MNVRVFITGWKRAEGRGILRLRRKIFFANLLASLGMTGIIWLSLSSASAWATTYYVSSSTGSDVNGGTSLSTAWQTIAHVNGQTFQPGDSVLFKRGDVWNESLVPPSSGVSGNPITFDAYGSGAAPNLTGYYAVPAAAWVLVTGNAWKAPVPATFTTINFCLFGSVWGQKVGASSSNLTAQWDFYLANGYVYIYSAGNPATYYNEPIVPMALSNVPVINVNGQSWLTFQHFLLNWFDDYGVYVQGASDHLVFANMEADSMIPEGTQPLGFYVSENSPGPGDIKIYNSNAHLNYDGFRFDGAATAVTMVNDTAYGNRDGALVDNTGAVTYSYCHFYASSLAVAGSTDVEWTSGSGPTAGAGNVAADTAPAVEVWQRYPAEVTLTVDDAGMTAGADTYYEGMVLPIADAAGVPVGVAITVGYPLAQTLISEFQGWIDAGLDVTSHSISHTYYTNTDALDVQYTGSGTAATLSINNKILTITVTGASDSVSYNLGLAEGQNAGTGIQTMAGLEAALINTGKFTATLSPLPCQGPYGTGCSVYTGNALLSQDLASVSAQDVKSAIYHMQLDVTRLTTDEITLSRQWMTTNLTGLPATPVYVYPGGYETTAMQGITASVPYRGARGALKEDLGVKDTYADGFDVQNITSFGVNPSWQGLQAAVLNQKIQALVWKEQVWGVPWGIFWHLNELSPTEITNLIADLKASGATVKTNTGLVNWLIGGTQESGTDGNSYYKLPAMSTALDFRPTRNSPVVDAGQNLGAAYQFDINGVNQNSYGSGWEIGAHVYAGYSEYGGGTGGSHFAIGDGAGNCGVLCSAAATLPQVWTNNNEGNSLFSNELILPGTWVIGPATGCTFHTPYWSGSATFAGLQSAVNDAEACRTATGAGLALDIPPGLYTTANALGLVIPQSNTAASSNFIVLRSTQDASLPNGTTVCSHGIQDNLATSTDIGMENPDCAGDAMYYQLGTTQTTVGTVHANNNLDDLPPYTVGGSNWNVCILPSCNPGGIGSPTATQTINNASPSLDGASMKMVCASSTASDCLFYYDAPAEDSDTSLTADFWTYLDANGSTANAFEFVMFQYIAGTVNTELHYSYQCDNNSGFWRIGNLAPSFSWVITTIPCSLSDLTWHHIIFRGHRIAGDTSCSGHPAEYYDSIAIDGIVYSSLPTECSIVLPNGWSEATGFNFQQDMGSSDTTLTQYVDEFNFTSINSAGPFTLANGTASSPSNYNDVQYMWTMESSGSNPSAISFCDPTGSSSTSSPPRCAATSIGPDHWLIEDGEVRMSTGNTGNNVILNQASSGTETSLTQYPSHIHLRKMWVHGDWASLTAGANSVSSAIQLYCQYCSIVDSQISEVLRPGLEGHSINIQGQGPYKIDHNWVEGSSIGLFTGGAESAMPYSIFGLMPFQDVEIRRNRFTFPYAWLGQNTIPSGNTHWSGSSITRKNGIEAKNGARVLYSGNIIENVDNSGGQSGVIADWNVQNFLVNYQLQMSDITFVNNVARNTCEGYEIDGSSPNNGSGGGIAYPFKRGLFYNNLLYNISASNPGCAGVNATNIETSAAAFQWQGTITQNSNGTATFTGNCAVSGGASGTTGGTCPGQLSGFASIVGGSGCVAGNLAISAPNIAGGIQASGTYACSGGVLSAANLTNQGSGYTSAPSVTIATGTGTLSATLINPATNPGPGEQVMDIGSGDHVAITMCQSVPGLNQPTADLGGEISPTGVGPLVTSGSAPWTGSYSASGITVSYLWSGVSPGTTDSSGYCTLTNISGNPQNLYTVHNTVISDSSRVLSSSNKEESGGGPNYAFDTAVQNNIYVTGVGGTTSGWDSNPGEGTPTETFNYDFTSLTADHNVFPGRNGSLYTAYGNNPVFPVVGPTMYFPSTGYCTGPASNSSCIGFTGAMSTSAMPLALTDYHGYQLRTDSSFYAGASEGASDGSAMGANIPAVDSAQAQTQYVCQSACGILGPFPD